MISPVFPAVAARDSSPVRARRSPGSGCVERKAGSVEPDRSPTRFSQTTPRTEVHRPDGAPPAPTTSALKIIDGFPATVRARALFLDRDNLNTDGIYAGKQ